MENKKSSLLIVDDETGILKLYREVFEARGWNVFTVSAGESALALMEKEKVNVVLLDIHLPAVSGINILKEMKRKYAGIPVVMMTALGYEDELVKESIRLGAHGYISKNVPLRELLNVVDKALAG